MTVEHNEMVRAQDVRTLAEFTSRDDLVASLYLDVDGRTHPRKSDYEAKMAPLQRTAEREIRARSMDRSAKSHAVADVRRAIDWVRGDFRRKSTRGIAVFSCAQRDLFTAISLPHSVKDRLVVNHSPYIRPLNALLSEYHRYGLILLGRKTSRLFVFYMGALVEAEQEVIDEVHGRHEQGGWSQARFSRHIEAEVGRHLKSTAAAASAVFSHAQVEKVLIGAQKNLAHELEKALLPELRKKVVARVSLPQNAGIAEIRKTVETAEEEIEHADDAKLVDQLRAGVGRGTAVSGLAGTLAALDQGRVEILIVSRGYAAQGWRCQECGWLAAIGPACPICEVRMVRVDEVVEEAIEETIARGRRAELVTANSDLDVMGRIGALLRF